MPPILVGVSHWCIDLFSERNSYLIKGAEKWKLIFIALFVAGLTTFLLDAPLYLIFGQPVYYLLIGVFIIAPVHFLMLLTVCYLTNKVKLKKSRVGVAPRSAA